MKSLLTSLLLALAVASAAQTFTAQPIPKTVLDRISGHSLPKGARIDASALRYLRISHYRPDGTTAEGEMIVHSDVAREVLDIFRELYAERYPIEQMRLIDDFDADDERSMAANNTSAFCYRTTPGSHKLSNHALGRAIDINPLYNPYVKGSKVLPAGGKAYVDRSRNFRMKITKQDAAVRIFKRYGWRWGGDYRSLKDYQHFEKPAAQRQSISFSICQSSAPCP